TCGWLLQIPRMADVFAGNVPMVFDTGLCFVLAGVALCAFDIPKFPQKTVQTVVGIILMLLCGICLAEHIFDIEVGVDFAGLHTWYNYGNTRPGRMAPNTALGFITIGATLLLMNRVGSRRSALLTLILTYGVLAIGLTGLGGYFLGPDVLFGWALSAKMSIHTAIGMMVCSTALRLGWHQADWYQSQVYLSERQKIAFSGIAVVVVATMTAGLAGFVVQQQLVEQALQQKLPTILTQRVLTLQNMIDESLTQSRLAMSDKLLAAAGRAMLNHSDFHSDSSQFADLANRLISGDVQSINLLDRESNLLYRAGNQAADAELVMQLPGVFPSSIQLSHGTYFIQTAVPLLENNEPAGQMVLQKTLRQIRSRVLGKAGLDPSTEIQLCKLDHGGLACFPTVRGEESTMTPHFTVAGQALPVIRGLAGQSGVTESIDDRGHRVAAAFAPIGHGLAMVVQEDTTELYGDIRQALQTSGLLMLVIAACGAALLHLQLTPLTKRLQESEAKLAALARVDSLTGLPNRYALNEQLHAAIARQARSDKALAVMFLDVDHFKTINDTLGHAMGDAVLKEFSARLKDGVRVTDIVARLAGDEFVIVAEGLHGLPDAEAIALSILSKVRKPWHIDGHPLTVTASIGIALSSANDLEAAQLLATADRALYIAKENGRDGFAWNAEVASVDADVVARVGVPV
ncbi:MAG TPA: GGDEF domain-containing protein, partial [Burkholderiaceae bacterium]|nr:GGDEF domain-containing protein [Burkholderiaceae bacterium]